MDLSGIFGAGGSFPPAGGSLSSGNWVFSQEISGSRTQNHPESVSAAQNRLRQLGYYGGAVTGAMNPPTAQAIRDFHIVNQTAPMPRDPWDEVSDTLGMGTAERLFNDARCYSTRHPVAIERLRQAGAAAAPPVPQAAAKAPTGTGPLSSGNWGFRQEISGERYHNDPESVSAVQNRLRQLGYYGGAVTGALNADTARAISNFHTANQTAPEGSITVGKGTAERMFDDARCYGTRHPEAMRRLGQGRAQTPSFTDRLKLMAQNLGRPMNPGNISQNTPVSQPGGGQAAQIPQRLAGLATGSQGPDVKNLQTLLVRAGFPTRPDGIFGPHTAQCVRSFQKAKGLTPTGVIDKPTFQALGSVSQVTALAARQPAAAAQPSPDSAPAQRAKTWQGVAKHLVGLENLSGHNGLGEHHNIHGKVPIKGVMVGYGHTDRNYGPRENGVARVGYIGVPGKSLGVKLNGRELSFQADLMYLSAKRLPLGPISQAIDKLPTSAPGRQALKNFVGRALPQILGPLKVVGKVAIDIGLTEKDVPYIRVNSSGNADIDTPLFSAGKSFGRSWQITSLDHLPR